MKTVTLRSISSVGWKESSLVSSRNQSLEKSQHEYPIGTIYQVTLDLLPSEHISGYEASKYIIGTYHSTCSDDEKLELGQIQSLVHELDK
jgi:hypothetical protein